MFSTITYIVLFQYSESIVYIGHEVNTRATSFTSLKKNKQAPCQFVAKRSFCLKYMYWFTGFAKGWAEAPSQHLAYQIATSFDYKCRILHIFFNQGEIW